MKSLKTKFIPTAIALAIILGAGYVHGVWSFRWTAGHALQTSSEQITQIPKNIGDWKGQDSNLDERQTTIGRINASLSRQYVNSKTGRAVTVLLVSGRPGPISAHSPEVCYAGSGYEIAGERTKVSVDYNGSQAQFWSIKVNKPDPTRPERMIIDYGWFSGGKWRAPDNARFEFASQPVLFKLYTIREQTRIEERVTFDPTAEFLKEFLPVMQKILTNSA